MKTKGSIKNKAGIKIDFKVWDTLLKKVDNKILEDCLVNFDGRIEDSLSQAIDSSYINLRNEFND